MPGLCGPLLHAGLGPDQGEEEQAEEGHGRYTASGHWGGALGSITAVMMGLYISTSHHYSGDFQTNAEVEKQVPGTHTHINELSN